MRKRGVSTKSLIYKYTGENILPHGAVLEEIRYVVYK